MQYAQRCDVYRRFVLCTCYLSSKSHKNSLSLSNYSHALPIHLEDSANDDISSARELSLLSQ